MKLVGTFECGFDRNLLTICPIGGPHAGPDGKTPYFAYPSGTKEFATNWLQLEGQLAGGNSIMLNLFRHSEEADLEQILAHHAVTNAASKQTGSHEKQFRDLLQALPAAIYTTDAEGRITFFNRACIDFAGRTPKIGDMWCVTWKLFTPDGMPCLLYTSPSPRDS